MTAHPAQYSPQILAEFKEILDEELHIEEPEYFMILDPFAGTGLIHNLADSVVITCGIELEPEWAAMSDYTDVGDATDLPDHWDERFDAVFTSPTFGNRMADSHNAKDDSRRITYTHSLGHSLSANNAGAMQWGWKYQELHENAWRESWRVLIPGGLMVVNVKNHIRKGHIQPVVEWHLKTLLDLGFFVQEVRKIKCTGMGFGQNRDVRVPYEHILVMRKP